MDDNGIFIDSAFFVWKKTDKGYYWDESQETKQEFGDIALVQSPKSTSFLQYYPLDDYPVLFIEFAEIEPTKENILQFVNKYGLLTKDFYKNTDKVLVEANSLRFCRSEIRIIQEAFNLFTLLKTSNLEELSKIIRWNLDKSNAVTKIRYTYTLEDSVGKYGNNCDITPETNPQIFSRFIVDDFILPARAILQSIINKQLKKHSVNLRLLLDNSNKLQPYLYPTTLLAAMWYQLYQAVATNKKFKRCAYCNKWNDITNKAHNWKACPGCAGRARAKKHYYKKKILAKNIYMRSSNIICFHAK